MKKILLNIILAIMVLSLISCSVPDDNIQPPSNVSTGNSNSSSSNVNVSATSATSSSKSETSSSTPETTSVVIPVPAEPTISETVLVDEKGVKITAKKLTDGFFGPEIKLLIENNSGKNLTFQVRNASVNGYMIETMLSVDVVNGKKANDSLAFMSSDLELCHITEIADMEFSFHIFTSEDWEDYLDTAPITLKTSIADSFIYQYDNTGSLAYEGNHIKILIKGLKSDDSVFGPGVSVYIENNSDHGIIVQTRDVSVNGFMIDAMFSPEISAGKKVIDSITFMSSDLEENEIISIESIELSFHIINQENWDTIADTDTVTISFQ